MKLLPVATGEPPEAEVNQLNEAPAGADALNVTVCPAQTVVSVGVTVGAVGVGDTVTSSWVRVPLAQVPSLDST